ncbi:DUF2157 domain-containing protein [Bradyrhizobium sp. LjRoot220]|uniref:DUF2157 domain-containing protein n=1 Tax=Bradyrhizobium sp. LjRoot220 TaxID=3342284 RepID=UPI003ECD1E58
MFERGYRQRLEADLVKWVTEGVISGDVAHSIRKARFGEEAVSRLPAIFAMLGALMLAASVSAFVAANWQAIPRLVRLGGILALIAACFPIALVLGRRAIPWGDDAAATFGTLCFGAGVALVGQMYHLPGDWPAGAMLVAIGAVIAAALTGKSGPLVIGFAAMAAWSFGRFEEEHWRDIHWPFFLLFVPACALALGRENRLVAHAAVLALSVWLGTLISTPAYRLVDGGIAFSVAYLAIGLLALDRDWPAEFRALLPWGAWAFGILLCFEMEFVLRESRVLTHVFDAHIGFAYVAALAALAALAVLPQNRDKGRLMIIAACAIALTIPPMIMGGSAIPSRMLAPVAVLVSAVTLIAGGLLVGIRTFVIVGYAVFGVAILVLLWRTVGTLLDQSLFFLAAGVVLLGLALGARRLAGWTRRADQMSPGGAV